MTYTFKALVVKLGTGIDALGSTMGVDIWDHKAVAVSGAFTGTITVEITLDKTNWAPAGTLTAPGVLSIPYAAVGVRLNSTSSVGGGTPVGCVAGHVRGA